MRSTRNKSKTKVVREVIEREEVDDDNHSDDEETLASALVRPKLLRKRIDPSRTVEELVFGVPRDPPVYSDHRSQANMLREDNVLRNFYSFGSPLGASSTPNISSYPQPTRAPLSQPQAQRIDSAFPPGFSTSSPNFYPAQPNPWGKEELQKRIADVERQIAMVNLALQGQGIATGLSEESQMRFRSSLQGRVRDLEGKLARVDAFSGPSSSGNAMEDDILSPRCARGAVGQDGVGPVSGNVVGNCTTDNEIRGVMFGLLNLIDKREEETDLSL